MTDIIEKMLAVTRQAWNLSAPSGRFSVGD